MGEVDVTAIWRPTYPPCPRRAPSRLLSHAYVKMLATVEAGAGAPRVASSRAATSCPAGPFRMAARRSKLQLRTAAEPEQKRAQEQQKSFLEAVTEEPSAGAKPPKTAYVDELPPVKKEEMSAAMRERLRREYYSLGGAPNKAMTNWFLYIILFISFLAISASLTGAI